MIREELTDMFEQFGGQIPTDADLLDFSREFILKHRERIPTLYRYSPADYYNIRSLETQTLFLSPIGSMNDVFEGLTCEIDDTVIDRIDELRDITFLKSFSEEKNNLLMWAHYSADYSGMCVEYDFRMLQEYILLHLFPIAYSERRLSYYPLDRALSEHKDLKRMNADNCFPNDCEYIKDIMALFLSKSSAWSYEREWRIIATYPQIFNSCEDMDDKNIELYQINGQVFSVEKCIKSVYLGPKMKKNIRDHIVEICAERLSGIPVFASKLSSDKYRLDFYPVTRK